jgi:urease accessory protein UreE
MSSNSTATTLTEVRGDLTLAALCVGQFHAPCQIENDHLLVKADTALQEALGALGLRLRSVTTVFNPAPMFAPAGATAGHGRRAVHHHVSHLHSDDDETEPPPASNA